MIRLVDALPWSVVDPAQITFDPEPARAIARKHVAALAAGEYLDARIHQCGVDIDRDLVAHYGPWIAGWDWSASDGGPVAQPFVGPDGARARVDDTHARVERVLSTVASWRAFLAEVAALQAGLRADCAGLAVEEQVERAAARYLPLVVDLTACEDAWYHTFAVVMRWHVEALRRARPLYE